MVVATRFVTGTLLVVGAGLLSACASSTQAPADPTSRGASTVPVTQSETTNSGDTFTMPDEVGKVLQTAQDDLQRATHDPAFYTGSKDATGRGRHQILDPTGRCAARTSRPAGGSSAEP